MPQPFKKKNLAKTDDSQKAGYFDLILPSLLSLVPSDLAQRILEQFRKIENTHGKLSPDAVVIVAALTEMVYPETLTLLQQVHRDKASDKRGHNIPHLPEAYDVWGGLVLYGYCVKTVHHTPFLLWSYNWLKEGPYQNLPDYNTARPYLKKIFRELRQQLIPPSNKKPCGRTHLKDYYPVINLLLPEVSQFT